MRCVYHLTVLFSLLIITPFAPTGAFAGDLNPPGPPASTMKTLNQVLASWDQKFPYGQRFKSVLDGEARLDQETGLVWALTPLATDNWADAVKKCFTAKIGQRGGWRMATIPELVSLMDFSHDPSRPEWIPGTQGNDMSWANTIDPADPGAAYYFRFSTGQALPLIKSFQEAEVYCVRGGEGR